MGVNGSDDRKEITIKDVAMMAGVSQATAGRVIGGYGSVSEKARKRVLEAAKELNYHPNSIAQSMKGKGTRTIGIVVANICNLFFSTIVRAVEDVAIKYGYHVIVCNSDEDFTKEISYIKTLYEKRVDGIISSTAYEKGKYSIKKVHNLYSGFIPALLIDRKIEGLDLPIVQTDNFQGAYDATCHLIKLGHRRIGLITGRSNMSTMAERCNGYIKAHQDNGIDVDPELIVDKGNVMINGGYDAARQILQVKNKPTALLALNHLLTTGTLLVIDEMGLKIPDDIAIIGWDDFELAPIWKPPLTVVSQSPYTIGTIAAEKLINILNSGGNRDFISEKVVELKTKLIVRKSCGTP